MNLTLRQACYFVLTAAGVAGLLYGVLSLFDVDDGVVIAVTIGTLGCVTLVIFIELLNRLVYRWR